MNKKNIPKFQLKLLLKQKLTFVEIGKIFNCTRSTVAKYLIKYDLDTSAKISKQNRDISLKNGDVTYLGKICEKDSSHGRKRYVSSFNCVLCVSNRQYEKRTQRRILIGKIPTKDKLNITEKVAYKNLLNAIKKEETAYQGQVCDYGHSGIRTVEITRKNKQGKYFRGRCVDCRRSKLYFQKYGITVETYNHILKEQKNRCRFCNKKDSGRESDTFLIVEHNHKNGNVRGLVCHNCNSLIERIESNLDKISSVKKHINQKLDYRKSAINKKSVQIVKKLIKRNEKKGQQIKGLHPSLYQFKDKINKIKNNK